MKKYYLHDGTESSGPFDIVELKAKKINQESPVWFEGQEKWKYAADIPELNSLFILQPPSFSVVESKPSKLEVEKDEVVKKQIFGLSKWTFFITIVVLIAAICIIIFNSLNRIRKEEFDKKNYQTAVENRQAELKQKENEAQKLIIQEATERATERAEKEKKDLTSTRIEEIEIEITQAKVDLETAKSNKRSATNFKIGRTIEAKNQELYELQKTIDSISTGIERLKIKSNQLKLEIEKIPKSNS